MTKEIIDYSALVDEAMHSIVKKSLEILAKNDPCGDHHFFISFITKYPGVTLSEKLRQKHPYEMTIVLQYQFENLEINEDSFSVSLSFDNFLEKIEIPFASLTAFADPSVKFGLQFRHAEDPIMTKEQNNESFLSQHKDLSSEKSPPVSNSSKPKQKIKDNVISLDFRNKKPKKTD